MDPIHGNKRWAFRLWNIALLGLGWCLSISGVFINISTTTVAASQWGSVSVSTLPCGFQILCSALFVVPGGKLAVRFGRRTVFVLAALLGLAGSCVMIGAAYKESYGLLILGAILQGPSFAVANNFRFVSAEFVTGPGFKPEWRTRAISLTVGFAVFAAAIGPETVRNVRDDVDRQYVGAYVVGAGLYLLQALLSSVVAYDWLQQQQQQQQQPQAALQDVKVQQLSSTHIESDAAKADLVLAQSKGSIDGDGRISALGLEDVKDTAKTVTVTAVAATGIQPDSAQQAAGNAWIRQSLLRAEFLLPAVAGAWVFCNMGSLMVATPIAMQGDGHSYDASVHVIEGHIVGMFLPGMIIADLLGTFTSLVAVLPTPLRHLLLLMPLRAPAATGKTPPSNLFPSLSTTTSFMVYGGCLMIVANVICIVGTGVGNYYAGLSLLGVAWAMVYVSGSGLVAAIFVREPSLRVAVQGAMDTLVVLGLATANTVSGPLLRAMGRRDYLWLNLASNLALFVWLTAYHAIVLRQWRL